MKKTAVTFFALFYLVLIPWSSFERTVQWAASAGHVPTHTSDSSAPALSEIRNHSSHDSQVRMVERDYVVESPVLNAPERLTSARSSSFATETTFLAMLSRGISSR